MAISRIFLEVLICPKCKKEFFVNQSDVLICKNCSKKWVVRDHLLVQSGNEHYSSSFGFQWNRFQKTQLDSQQKQGRSEKRFFEETGWNAEFLADKIILDAGCGAGRFSEVALKYHGNVISIDASSAVFAAHKNLSKDRSIVIQSDLESVPIKDASVNLIFCIGVLQHTQNPKDIVKELIRVLARDGEVVFTFYESKGLRTKLYSKYMVRPFTRKLNPEKLLRFIEISSHIWFPITRYLYSLPAGIGKVFAYILPFANYVNYSYTSKGQAREEAILDTFDMLSPKFDRPITKTELREWVGKSSYTTLEMDTVPKFGTLKFKRIE